MLSKFDVERLFLTDWRIFLKSFYKRRDHLEIKIIRILLDFVKF